MRDRVGYEGMEVGNGSSSFTCSQPQNTPPPRIAGFFFFFSPSSFVYSATQHSHFGPTSGGIAGKGWLRTPTLSYHTARSIAHDKKMPLFPFLVFLFIFVFFFFFYFATPLSASLILHIPSSRSAEVIACRSRRVAWRLMLGERVFLARRSAFFRLRPKILGADYADNYHLTGWI